MGIGKTRVYIGDLDSRVTKEDIKQFFRNYGPIISLWVARKPMGFAFVEFKYAKDADDAVYYKDGKSLLGKRVRVEMARGRRRPMEYGRRDGRRSRRSYSSRSRSYSRSRSRSRGRRRRSRSYRSRSRRESNSQSYRSQSRSSSRSSLSKSRSRSRSREDKKRSRSRERDASISNKRTKRKRKVRRRFKVLLLRRSRKKLRSLPKTKVCHLLLRRRKWNKTPSPMNVKTLRKTKLTRKRFKNRERLLMLVKKFKTAKLQLKKLIKAC